MEQQEKKTGQGQRRRFPRMPPFILGEYETYKPSRFPNMADVGREIIEKGYYIGTMEGEVKFPDGPGKEPEDRVSENLVNFLKGPMKFHTSPQMMMREEADLEEGTITKYMPLSEGRKIVLFNRILGGGR